MSRARIAVIAAVVLVGAGFVVGFLPEHRLRSAAEQQSHQLRQQLDTAEARTRMAELLGEVLAVKEVAMRQDYGRAQDLSSSFFNRVRGAAASAPMGEFREVLEEVLARRDVVTASLTKADPGVVEVLHTIELRIRAALGYPLPAEPTPNGHPPATGSPPARR